MRALDAMHAVERLTTDVFIDPVLQRAYAGTPALFDADWVIEVGFKPGVTDNVGRTAREVIEAVSGLRFRGRRRSLHVENVFPQRALSARTM